MIAIVGDSITYGQHLEDRGQAWPYLLTGIDRHVAGVPGDTTRLALERFPADVQSREPQAVIIQFGHNDANRWDTDRGLPRVSRAAYMANLVEMIDRCEAFDAKPYLCTLTPSYRSAQHAEDVYEYDQALRDVAAMKIVSLIDVRDTFGLDPELVMADGLHLTPMGHQVYAATVMAALR